ncbi:MAG: DUF5123 domain-containing protein, partial [Candidatus Omnitrophica bacterium]|nr:DUF5123 domain-containing protein [Candidatus Omnitrophota bacterium]
ASNNYSETVNIKNNIFYVNSSTSYISNSYGMVTVDYNNYYGNGDGPEADTHAVNGDPKFTDAANGNFSLQASSPCIDAGYDTSAIVFRDKDGIVRPQNLVVDIGAYEYTLAAPSNLSAAVLPEVITLGWEDNSNEEIGFKIERKAEDLNSQSENAPTNPYLEIATVGADTVLYNDTYDNSMSYVYRVKAYNSTVNSDYSNEVLVVLSPDTDGNDDGSGSSGTSSSSSSSGGSSSGGGSGCFIATAVFGTPMAEEVVSLCGFRDKYLLPNECGKRFVQLYYTYSPAIANYIAKHDSLRAMMRICLKPLIALSKALCE